MGTLALFITMQSCPHSFNGNALLNSPGKKQQPGKNKYIKVYNILCGLQIQTTQNQNVIFLSLTKI